MTSCHDKNGNDASADRACGSNAAGLQKQKCGNKPSSEMERRDFCEEEEDLIIRLHALLGDRWSLIAGRLPGRSEKEVEMYWDSHVKRRLMNLGIDPENHRVSQITRGAKNNNRICSDAESSNERYVSKSL